MHKLRCLLIVVAVVVAGGCENMTPTQRGAVTGGALGTGIGMVAGGSFGQVVGAGLIGGAAGAIVGSAAGSRQAGTLTGLSSSIWAKALASGSARSEATPPPPRAWRKRKLKPWMPGNRQRVTLPWMRWAKYFATASSVTSASRIGSYSGRRAKMPILALSPLSPERP